MSDQMNRLEWTIALIVQLESLEHAGLFLSARLLHSQRDCMEAQCRPVDVSPAHERVPELRIVARELALR
jgi:hypothetical protein